MRWPPMPLWVISESVVARDVEIGQLLRLSVDMRATLGPIGITTRSGAELSLRARTLINLVHQSVSPYERSVGD